MSPYVETTGQINRALRFGFLPNENKESIRGPFFITLVEVANMSYINFLEEKDGLPPKYLQNEIYQCLSSLNMPEKIAQKLLSAIKENNTSFRVEFKTIFSTLPNGELDLSVRNFQDYKIVSGE